MIFILAPMMVLLFSVFDLAQASCFINLVDGKKVRSCNSSTNQFGESYEFDCRTGSCNVCGICHVAPARVDSKYPAEQHVSRNRYILKPGETVAWDKGTYLTTINGRKCLMHDRKPIHCFSENAVVAANSNGQPVGVLTPQSTARPLVPKKPEPIRQGTPVEPLRAIPQPK